MKAEEYCFLNCPLVFDTQDFPYRTKISVLCFSLTKEDIFLSLSCECFTVFALPTSQRAQGLSRLTEKHLSVTVVLLQKSSCWRQMQEGPWNIYHYAPLLTLAQYFLVGLSGFYFLSVYNSYFKDIVELHIQTKPLVRSLQ